MEQVKHPRCRAVVGILNASQSKQLIKWRHLVLPIHLLYFASSAFVIFFLQPSVADT